MGFPEHAWVYPEYVTLPMGWTGSVAVAQTVTEKLFADWTKQFAGVFKFVNLKDQAA